METRQRSRRGEQAPASQVPAHSLRTRTTRQTVVASTAPASSNAGSNQSTRPRPESSQPTPHRSRPPGMEPLKNYPRRGAPPRAESSASIASIATVPPRPDDETELGEEDRTQELVYEDEEEDGDAISDPAEGSGDEVDLVEEKARRQIMVMSLPDLTRATDSLMQHIMEPNYHDAVFRGCLHMKRNALLSVREVFDEEETTPFIDWVQMIDRDNDTQDVTFIATVTAAANIAAALDEVLILQNIEQSNPFLLLDKLNSLFPSYFITNKDDLVSPELTLDIRTWYFIETLAAQKQKIEPFPIIAAVFCEPAEGVDLPRLFSHGPFKSLWDQSEVDYLELCSARITEIISTVKSDKKTFGLKKLKEKYPWQKLMDDLRDWLTSMYELLKAAQSISQNEGSPEITESIVGYVGDDVEESQADSASISQPIVRAGHVEEQPSLFRNKESLAFLDAQRRARNSVPPSNQQQLMPPPSAPRDYEQHTNSELLGQTPPPGSLGAFKAPSQRRLNAPTINNQRPQLEEEAAYGGGRRRRR
ncbi:hypothetical protein G7046_g4673 [Stylonectria norvegica]|nr:hypothetical protein G7046_g4673 [Stylonectria norvegica]